MRAAVLLLMPAVVASSSLGADLTVVNSLGPVRGKETVVSFAPNFQLDQFDP
eukprot:COSAG02_NODE_1283_length_13471_cov_12.121223_15_plen_52_part_00